MLKKLMMVVVVTFSMIVYINAQEVTENIEKASNDVQDATAGDKAAEEKAIAAEEKTEEKVTEEADKKLEKDADTVTDSVKKEMAEGAALGKEEAQKNAETELEKVPEPEVAKQEKSSSWWSWLWPFGGGDDSEENVQEAVPAEAAPAKEAEIATIKEVEVVEPPVKEPAVEEPAVKEKSSSWWSWLWPFGGGDDNAEEVAATEPVEEVVAVEEAPAVEEVVAVEEAPAVEKVVAVEEAPAPADVEVKEAVVEESGKTSFTHKALFYFPNLFMDFTDIMSGSIGVGAESGLRIGATRWFQLGGNYGDTYFLEKGYLRTFGGGYNNGYTGQLGPLAIEKRYIIDTFGSIEPLIINQESVYIPRKIDKVYAENIRDFYSFGVEGGWLINFNFQIHPIEIADFFTGLIGIDICDDNY